MNTFVFKQFVVVEKKLKRCKFILNLLNSTHVAAVVDEPGQVAALGGVDDGVLVDPEEVTAADAFLLVASLAHVRYHLMTSVKNHTSSWIELTLEQGYHKGSSVVRIRCASD